MLLLGVDTSGPAGSLALALGDAEHFEVLEVATLAAGTYSAQLIPTFSALLARHNRSKLELGGFAVASGPGSFTGLRVGLSSVKAMADVLGQPIAAVSVLQAVGALSETLGKVIAGLDAGRKQVYVGEYDLSGGAARMVAESLLTVGEFEAAVSSYGEVEIVTPDIQIAELVRTASVRVIDRPKADAFARLGLRKILAGEITPPAELEANYIRRSDAEIFARPR